jgi:hypothetical protein
MVRKTDPLEEKEKRLEEYSISRPEQLSLFELLGQQNKPYSNTIELYDFMPKFFWGKMERIKVEKPNKKGDGVKEVIKEVLPNLERPFECRGTRYVLRIEPASIKGKDGIDRDFYPGKREEIVEAVLRKLAAEGHGIFLDDAASVMFTLYQLQKEMQEIGHGYNKNEIKEALQICKRTNLIITSQDGKTILESNILETLGLQTQEEWKGTGHKTKCYVRFNPLVTKSIKDRTFRLLNYGKNLSLDSVVARKLNKRMSHHFTQASLMNHYDILLSTMIRDFGLTQYKKLSDNWRDVESGLKELKKKEVILDYKKENLLDVKRRNKLADIKIFIVPHPRFISDIVKGNERHKKAIRG